MQLQIDKAAMAIMGGRYKEAEGIYLNLIENNYTENGWIGLGISKLYQIDNGVALNEVKEWQFSEMRPEDAKIKELSYQTESVYGFGHPLYYDNVIKTFQGKEEPLVDGQEGLASLELLIAAYRAARDGITVHLPLEL